MERYDKRIIKECIDVGFDIKHIKSTVITDTDDDNKSYKKTISYMENASRIQHGLILLLHGKSKQVARVVDYIQKNLAYNDTNIVLNPSEIARCYNDDRSNIAKAIKELITMDIIRKISDYIPNNNLPKNTYGVNFNYICNGNIHTIKKLINNQRNGSKD